MESELAVARSWMDQVHFPVVFTSFPLLFSSPRPLFPSYPSRCFLSFLSSLRLSSLSSLIFHFSPFSATLSLPSPFSLSYHDLSPLPPLFRPWLIFLTFVLRFWAGHQSESVQCCCISFSDVVDGRSCFGDTPVVEACCQ